MDWIDEVCDPDFALKVVIEEDSDAEHLKRLQINIGKLYNAWGSQCTKLVHNLQDYASLRGPRSWRVQASTQLQLGALVFDTLQQQTSAKTKQAGFGALGLCVAHTTKMMRACSEMLGSGATASLSAGCVPDTMQAVQILMCMPEIHESSQNFLLMREPFARMLVHDAWFDVNCRSLTQRDLVRRAVVRLHWLYEAHLRLELAMHLLWKYWCKGLSLPALADRRMKRQVDYLSLEGVPHSPEQVVAALRRREFPMNLIIDCFHFYQALNWAFESTQAVSFIDHHANFSRFNASQLSFVELFRVLRNGKGASA